MLRSLSLELRPQVGALGEGLLFLHPKGSQTNFALEIQGVGLRKVVQVVEEAQEVLVLPNPKVDHQAAAQVEVAVVLLAVAEVEHDRALQVPVHPKLLSSQCGLAAGDYPR